MKKLGTFISLLCILNILAILGLAGYLVGTGRLNKAKAQTITDMLRTQNTPGDLREKTYDLLYPVTATQPATSTAPSILPALAASSEIPATATDRNAYVRKTLEEEQLRLQNQAQDLQNRQEWLAQEQAVLEAKYQQFDAEKKKLEAQTSTTGKEKDDAAFTRMMSYFDELKPKQIKDLLFNMAPDEACRYLTAMDAEQVAKVMAEFKSQPEKERLTAIVNLLRGASQATGTSAALENAAGLTAAAPAPKAGS